MLTCGLGAQVERVHRHARCVQHVYPDLGCRSADLKVATDGTIDYRQQFSGQHHIAAHQRSALQGLHLQDTGVQTCDAGVQALYTANSADLRHLRGHLRVVHWVEWVLILELGDQQLEELLAHVSRALGGAAQADTGA